MDSCPLSETGRLLVGARAGKEEFRARLIWRYRDPLIRLLRGRLSPSVPLETGDVVQSVMITALSNLETFEYRGVGSFWRYLRTIAVHRAGEENRKHLRRPVTTQDSSTLEAVAAGECPDPVDSACERETSEKLEAALQALDEQVREALLLRIELDVPYAMIADECGYCSADAARMAIGRGLQHLSRSLAAWKDS